MQYLNITEGLVIKYYLKTCGKRDHGFPEYSKKELKIVKYVAKAFKW